MCPCRYSRTAGWGVWNHAPDLSSGVAPGYRCLETASPFTCLLIRAQLDRPALSKRRSEVPCKRGQPLQGKKAKLPKRAGCIPVWQMQSPSKGAFCVLRRSCFCSKGGTGAHAETGEAHATPTQKSKVLSRALVLTKRYMGTITPA